MPKLKYQSMLDDEEIRNVPVSNTYTAKPKIMRAQGLQSLQDLIKNIEIEESKMEMDRRFAEAEARSEAKQEQPKPKRKYVRRVKAAKPTISKIRGVKEKALFQAIATLKALNCAFRIYVDNTMYEEGEMPGSKTRRTDREYGSMAKYYKPFIENLKIGGTATVPYNPMFQPEDIRSSITAWMASNWGKGSYTTMFDKQKNLEILRVQ
jgi:hypothetical protein